MGWSLGFPPRASLTPPSPLCLEDRAELLTFVIFSMLCFPWKAESIRTAPGL